MLVALGALLAGTRATAALPVLVESAREVPVAGMADVVVVGGSTGAVAAAVAAARAGAAVILLAPRPYLGEDMAATLRLWLEAGEEPRSELGRAIFCAAAHRGHEPRPELVPFTYQASLPSAARHADSAPSGRLADDRYDSAAAASVQYDGDVAITLDVGQVVDLGTVTAQVYHRADYRLEEMAVAVGVTADEWHEAGRVRCARPEQSGPDAAAEPLSLALQARGRYLRLSFTRSAGSTRVLLGEIQIQRSGLPVAATDSALAAIRPLHLKQVLDRALLDAGVRFLYASVPTDVLRDRDGRLGGVVAVNRSGRQAIVGKVVIDASERAVVAQWAGAAFRPFTPGTYAFRRTVIGGEPHPVPGGRVRSVEPALWRQAKAYRVYEYTLPLALAADDWRAWMAVEHQARTLTYDPQQQFAAEMLFLVPPDAVLGEASVAGPWPGSAAALPLGVFQPRGVPGVFVLGGRADVSPAAAEALLRPLALIEAGERVGTAAAELAKTLDAPRGPALPAASTAAPGKADTRETLSGPRPFQKWESLSAGAREAPVLGRWDVIVVGGGVSGVPAAIGAARQGASTLLLEAQYGLGGMGTLGAISIYCHGYRGGFTAEVPGAATWPIEERTEWWRTTTLGAGGEVWFGALGCGAVVEAGQVRGVVVTTPRGRAIVLATVVIDATGNADVAAAAGAACVTTDGSDLAVQGTGLPPRNLGAGYTNTDFTLCDETDAVDVTTLFVASKAKYRPDTFDQGVLVDTRERRRVVGEATLTILDEVSGRTYPDTVLLARTNYDTHGYTVDPYFLVQEAKGARRFDTFLPYRCLLPRGLEGLLVTGLGVSVHRDAQPLIRMQPDLQNLGYACGVAAAMAREHGGALRRVEVRKLQRHLVDKGCLPAAVLEQGERPALTPTQLATAVASAASAEADVATLLGHPEQSIPELRRAWSTATEASARLSYAHLLAVQGDAAGVDDLVAAVQAQPEWGAGWNYRAMGQFGSDMSRLDATIVALGRTRHPAAVAPILRLTERLDAGTDFSHHRAAALALEALADPRAAPVLAAVLRRPEMSGYALADAGAVMVAETIPDPSLTALTPRRNALREIYLARALYRCGDCDGLGERLLTAYLQDVRGHFARHAKAVLEQGSSATR
jgi:hypothetical protein